MHFQTRAKLVREWRTYFKDECVRLQIPPLETIAIEVYPILRSNNLQDTAACAMAAKAAIDGIVDAGVIEDDAPRWLKWITFYPCEVVKGTDALMIRIVELPSSWAAPSITEHGYLETGSATP